MTQFETRLLDSVAETTHSKAIKRTTKKPFISRYLLSQKRKTQLVGTFCAKTLFFHMSFLLIRE